MLFYSEKIYIALHIEKTFFNEFYQPAVGFRKKVTFYSEVHSVKKESLLLNNFSRYDS